MTKRILIPLAVLFVVAAFWLGYRAFRPNRPLSALVPSDALLVLESSHLLDSTTAQMQRRALTLNQIPLFEQAVANLARPMFATGDTASVRQFMRGKAVRSSLHPASKNSLDFLFYIPIDTDADRQFVDRLFKPDANRFRVLTRPFDGERISELITLRNESFGHFMQTDHALVYSSSGILVENVARRLHQAANLLSSNDALSTDAGQLASLSVRPEVLQRLFSNENSSLVGLFLPENLTLHFRPTASRTHLVGYASDQIGQRTDVAALFQNQTPNRISAGSLIPQNTSAVYHISVSDGAAFGQSISRLLSSNSDVNLQNRLKHINTETGAFYSAIGSDVLLCRLESPSGRPRQVLIVQGRDGAALSRAYQQAAYRVGAVPAPLKTFLGHKTILLNVAELPATLFTNLFAGFRQSWVTQHGSALIVANGEDVMQEYLQQVTQQFVWSADERQANLLDKTLRPANFTAFVRLNRSSQNVSEHWPVAWRTLFGSPSTGFGNLENMVYQASYGNEKILSTLVLGRTTRRASGAVVNKVLLRRKVEFNASLIAAPVVVGNLSDGSAQFYAQNQAGQFVLVTPEGDKIVQDTTDGPIQSNVIATDFLDNGKLQYLFMTDRRLYVAQPGNQSVKLERIKLPPGLDPTFLAQPRGSRQRSVVALAAHKDGHIYALDRQRRAFIKLMTAQTPGPLLLPFQVVDTPTGMEVLAMQGDGTLNRWQDNGIPVIHYPAKLGLPFVSPALQPANVNFIQAMTEGGELLQLNPNGLIASRNQLYRPVRAGSFRLLPDVSQQTWLLMRTSDTEAAILDQQGNDRFAVRGLQPDKTNIRYHRLGGGIDLISVKSGKFTTLYTLDGKRVGDRSIPGDFPVALQFDELTNELYVLTGVEKAVQLFSIRLR